MATQLQEQGEQFEQLKNSYAQEHKEWLSDAEKFKLQIAEGKESEHLARGNCEKLKVKNNVSTLF